MGVAILPMDGSSRFGDVVDSDDAVRWAHMVNRLVTMELWSPHNSGSEVALYNCPKFFEFTYV